LDKVSLEKLREASAAEAEAASAVWQSVQAISSSPADERYVSDDNSHAADAVSDGSDTEGDVHLHPRAVGAWNPCAYKLMKFLSRMKINIYFITGCSC
jgi:protein phosphatase